MNEDDIFKVDKRRIAASIVVNSARSVFEKGDSEMKKSRIESMRDIREFLEGNVARQEGFAMAYDLLRGAIGTMLLGDEFFKDDDGKWLSPERIVLNLKRLTTYTIGEIEIPLIEAITGEEFVPVDDPVDGAMNFIKEKLSPELIREAFKDLPPSIIDKITETLNARGVEFTNPDDEWDDDA